MRIFFAFLAVSALGVAPASAGEIFDEDLFRKCYRWMTEGKGGALIDNLCLDIYGIPPPTLFICARKIQEGFDSEADRKSCVFVFEDYTRRIAESRVR